MQDSKSEAYQVFKSARDDFFAKDKARRRTHEAWEAAADDAAIAVGNRDDAETAMYEARTEAREAEAAVDVAMAAYKRA